MFGLLIRTKVDQLGRQSHFSVGQFTMGLYLDNQNSDCNILIVHPSLATGHRLLHNSTLAYIKHAAGL